MDKVLIIGSGGREHALARKFAQSPRIGTVYVAPGRAGMEDAAIPVDISPMDFEGLSAFAESERIALTFVGSEMPLIGGIVDYFGEKNLPIFGPKSNAAILEGSKSFAKNLMKKYRIPTADYEVFVDYESAVRHIQDKTPPFVLKADGLAGGKGVIIAATPEEAEEALSDMLEKNKFGASGTTVVIEQFLEGEEFSFHAFVRGRDVYPMVIAQDHKRAFDGDMGPNTGGMGAYAPVPHIGGNIVESAYQNILLKTAAAMMDEGRPFTGILYAGLIATREGPKVIEYNVRFGDPETEVILPLLESDIYEVLSDILADKQPQLTWSSDSMIGLILAAKGYPGSYQKGALIEGLDALDEETYVFHCGTDKTDAGFVTAGGRVLFLASKAPTLQVAREKLYREVKKIRCDNLFYRSDIGGRACQS